MNKSLKGGKKIKVRSNGDISSQRWMSQFCKCSQYREESTFKLSYKLNRNRIVMNTFLCHVND